jgi:hypothetical protein
MERAMEANTQRSLWQKVRKPLEIFGIIVAFASVIALIVTIIGGYLFNWGWTGFNIGESKITMTTISNGTTTAKELQPAKNLWDWLQLLGVLAIPVVVGLGTVWFTTQQAKQGDANREKRHQTEIEIAEKNREKQQQTELQIASDNQCEADFQAYIDKMSELLLKEHLGELKPAYEEVRKIARVRTLTVLQRLNPGRKESILQFLYESGLITAGKSIINLHDANLSQADLSGINLRGANLGGVNLRGANLSGVNLCNADLSGSDLYGANMSEALLNGNIGLSDRRVTGLEAILENADLRGVNLSHASVTRYQLELAKSLQGAILPDGSKDSITTIMDLMNQSPP